jgi:hypothetical protein
LRWIRGRESASERREGLLAERAPNALLELLARLARLEAKESKKR